LLELLQYDYSCLRRTDEITFTNDAMSCYDCIVPSISNVAARSRGLHRNIAEIHGEMLKHARYKVKTQLGVSKRWYSHSDESPIFGTGQGSKSSPPIWANNCSIYFDVFNSHCHGARYSDSREINQVRLGMIGFVDDNRCQVNGTHRDREQIIIKATHDAQLWSDILWASGGALEHNKCGYYWRQSVFDRNGAPNFRTGTFGPQIRVNDGEDNPVSLQQIPAYKAYKTLGTFQCVGSNQAAQYQALMDKAIKITRTLSLSACKGAAAKAYYDMVFCKSIGYPLTVSRLTEGQINAIQQPMINLILNRMGYSKKLARFITVQRKILRRPRFGQCYSNDICIQTNDNVTPFANPRK
jgi:hypothetical protein